MTSYLRDLIAEIAALRRTTGYRILTIVATFAMAFVVTVIAAGTGVQSSDRMSLSPFSDPVAQHPSDVSDGTTVFPSEETRRIEAPDQKVAGPKRNLAFIGFLADGPSSLGAVQYTSRFSNALGNESMRVDSIFNRVFGPQKVRGQRRTDIYRVEGSFTDPQGHEGCVASFAGTSFDRAVVSGATTMSSRNAFHLVSLNND